MSHTTSLLPCEALLAAATTVFATARSTKAQLSAIVINIDGLRQINETYGALAGDQVFGHFAQLIDLNIQSGIDLAGRLSDAEIILFLPEADYRWAEAFASRLRGSFANRPLRWQDELIDITASFGITALMPEDHDIQSLIDRACDALTAAKRNGGNSLHTTGTHDLAVV